MTQARHLLYRAVPAGTDSPVAPAWAPLPADAEHLAADGLAGLRWEGSVPSAEEAAALPEDWALASLPQSVAAAPAPLVVTDVDSTLIQQEVIELLAAHTGREAEVAAVTERAMRGELDFAQSLHARVQALAGLPASVVDDVVARVRPTDGAVELISAVNAAGGRVCAVSGGFTQVLSPLAERWGLHAHAANRLEIVDGALTGRVVGDVVDRAAKARMLRHWAAEASLDPAQAVGVGDGANDIDLLDTAGCGVALCAKPALRVHAQVILDLPSLTPLRWLLGL